jgi:hypothetical protein
MSFGRSDGSHKWKAWKSYLDIVVVRGMDIGALYMKVLQLLQLAALGCTMHGYFRVLGSTPVQGREFTTEDDVR